ncbi:UNVERIFIED_CONTAM: hypothetical protein PYX00_001176 [Menopon gallinae]|uniref:WD repeat domain-containing protein 83 n=1 Tax=Menopon gallinae TaxID=328185 RepID=A0AAW2ID32_9NEOP
MKTELYFSHIVSCGADKTVILWDVGTGQIIKRFRGHAGKVSCVKYNEESTVAVSGSHDNTVICWDIKGRKNEPIQILREAKDCITSIQVTDHEILVGSLDSYIRCYDIRMGKITRDFIGDPVIATCFTQDSQCILASSCDIIRLMDKETGELLTEYKGHKTGDYMIESCLDSKDKYILSGSTDGNLYCWELISNKLVKKFPHPNQKTVHSVSPHPSGNYFLTAAGHNIYLWGSPTSQAEG